MSYLKKTILFLLVLFLLFNEPISPADHLVKASYRVHSESSHLSTFGGDFASYPPLLPNQYSGISGIQQFGVSLESFSDSQISRADEANAYWVRQDVFNWKLIEPTRENPPEYDWSSVDEAWLQDAAARGLKVIAVIKHTPNWAQKYSGVSCGPIKEDRLDEFAQFLEELVNRYGQYIQYWEVGNEPDIDRSLVSPDNEYGCWGEDDEPYYGGEYYGKMLSYAYPALKNADQNAQLLVGGLLLDCDPDYDYSSGSGYKCDPRPGKFFEGILRFDEDPDDGEFDGWKYFDIIPYHAFNIYTLLWRIRWDEVAAPAWIHRGGHIYGKADFLRDVMADPDYNVEKPIMVNETSLLCPEGFYFCNPPVDDFFDAQAEFVVWVNVRNIANGIFGTVWHTLPGPGWRNGGLMDGDTPKKAFNSFKFMGNELRNATFIEKTIENYPACADLRAYKFLKGGTPIWVMWTGDETDCVYTLPADAVRVLDIYGSDITPSGGVLTIRAPVYVEFPSVIYLPLVMKND